MSLEQQLIDASENGHTETVKLLLDRGADIHAYNDKALRYASQNGHTETVKLLLDRGANIHAENDKALRWASLYGYTEIVKLLLDRGANVYADGCGALSWATISNHTETVNLLKRHIEKEKFKKSINTTVIKIEKDSISITEKFNLEEINCDKEIEELKNIINY